MSARRPLSLAVAALAATALAACGSSGSGSSTAAAPAGGPAVVYKNFDASPRTLRIKLGQTVTWTNKDPVAHNVVSTVALTGDKMASPSIAGGATFSYRPTVPGTIQYVCTFHSQMTGYKIIVVK